MKTTLTKMFVVLVLMMIGMGAKADVKVYFGEKGTEKFEGSGGTVEVKQEESKDDNTQVTVYLGFIPQSGYSFDEKSLEIYAVIPTDANSTRTPDISDSPLKLEEDKSENPGEKHYHVTIDSKLGLWVKKAVFLNGRKSGVTVTYHIINLGRLDDEGKLSTTRTEALQFTVTDENSVTVGGSHIDKYKSPLAKEWKYYSASDVTYNSTTKVCVFNSGPSLTETSTLTADADVFVTYELDDSKFSTVIRDGGIYRIKFPNNYYLHQSKYNAEINTASSNVSNPTSSEYFWRFNIVDPYQITVQSQSQSQSASYLNYYLSSKTGKTDFADIRLQQTLAAAKATKAWAFSLLPGGASGKYRLIVTDGITVPPNNTNQLDSEGHGYLNNKREGYKTTYHLYNKTNYERCDLTFESLNIDYTYHIVDTQGNIAIKYKVNQPIGTPLLDYEDIPEAIRSPYLEGEEVTFYTAFLGGTRENLQSRTTYTPVGTDIYVSYTTTKDLINKPLHLGGQRNFHMQVNGKHVYDNSVYDDSGTLSCADDAPDSGNASYENYLWKFSGQDPYRVQVQNKGTSKYLNWSTTPSASLSLGDAATSYFIILGGSAERPSGVPEDYTDQVELMAATGADAAMAYYNVGRDSDVGLLSNSSYGHTNAAIQVLLKVDARNTTFHIIDKSGRIVIEESGDFTDLKVPEKWESPLVSQYHFYKREDFTVNNGVYTLKESPAGIPDFTNAPIDIYVTYDVKTYDDTGIDLDGGNNRDNEGKPFLLKFLNGKSYRLENGKDKLPGRLSLC